MENYQIRVRTAVYDGFEESEGGSTLLTLVEKEGRTFIQDGAFSLSGDDNVRSFFSRTEAADWIRGAFEVVG